MGLQTFGVTETSRPPSPWGGSQLRSSLPSPCGKLLYVDAVDVGS